MTRSALALLMATVPLLIAVRAEARAYWGPVVAPAFDKVYYPGGTTHTIETRDLKSVNGSTPDTYLYVFSRQTSPLGTYYWRLEAKDDDGGDGYASKVVNVAVGGVVRVIVAAYSPYRRGTCDIYIDGVRQAFSDDVTFGGWRVSLPSWSGGSYPYTPPDRFRVAGDPSNTSLAPIADSYLYQVAAVGSTLREDDDSGSYRQAYDVAGASCGGDCTVLVSAYTIGTVGYALLVHKRNNQPDVDGDGLNADTESDLLSDDTKVDTDGDKISDFWEVFGIPPKAPETLAGSYDDSTELHAMGAWPGQRNIFLYVDTMPGAALDAQQQNWLLQSFRDDTAYTGVSSITPILLLSDAELPSKRYMARLPCTLPKNDPSEWTSLEELKSSYVDPVMGWFAHYVVVGTPGQYYNWNDPDPYNNGCARDQGMSGEAGTTEIAHWRVDITLYNPSRGVLMHEIGHNLGLWHHTTAPIHPYSVMNYRYATSGFTGSDQQLRWSYANGNEGTLCDVNDRTVCVNDGNCECDEWQGIEHPFPTCGDGLTDGQLPQLPGYEYARCCQDNGGRYLCGL